METQEQQDAPKKQFARRDGLMELEKQAQAKWEQEKTYQAEPIQGQKKFLLTFPYPYLNGRLHLGHAYTMTKVDFTARYKRLQGYNVVFPFGFHCTGQPICAAANKLQSEIQNFGCPPTFPKQDEDKRQWNILKKMGISEEEIPKFVDAKFWTGFFHPFATQDLKYFGVSVDHRRSFITTDVNPYYDSFIRWQFTQLKEKNYIKFGKRPSIYSIADKQMCADHDRAEGEGLGPQEYTLIKLKVLDLSGALAPLQGRNVYLAAATLRPETMYGQTNCYVLPEGTYGAFEMINDEVFIISERAAKNMAYQDLTKELGVYKKLLDVKGTDLIGLPLKAPLAKYEKVYALPMLSILMDKGTGVVTSVPSDAPDDFATLRDLQKKQAFREKYGLKDEQVLPFEAVPIIEIPEMGNLSALQACEEFKVASGNDKEKLKLAKDKCYTKGFYDGVMLVGKYAGRKVQDAKALVKKDLIETGEAATYYEPEGKIISRSGDECIVSLCDQWYISYEDENWKKRVREHVNGANFNCYNNVVLKSVQATVDWLNHWGCSRSFGLGTRLPFDEQYLIESLSDSTIYMAYYTIVHLLQGNVVGSQTGPLGITPDQLNNDFWSYIFLNGNYNENIKVPEDKCKQLKESFLYWYPLDLRASAKDLIKNHLTMALFNHAAIWDQQPEMWPRSYFVNGYMLVDGKKMSKQNGNFFTLKQIVDLYGADATRFALSESGDTQDDANFEIKIADNSILKISTLEMWLKEYAKDSGEKRSNNDQLQNSKAEFFDKVFSNQIKRLTSSCVKAYEELKFRDVTKFGFHEFGSVKDEYLINCEKVGGPRKDILLEWIQYQLLLLYPITPHFCEIAWSNYYWPLLNQEQQQKTPQSISQARLPDVSQFVIDDVVVRSYNCLQSFLRNVRLTFAKQTQTKKGAKEVVFNKVIVVYTLKYNDWQNKVLEQLRNSIEGDVLNPDWKNKVRDSQELTGDVKKKCLQFAAFMQKEYETSGKEAVESVLPFNELQLLQDNKEAILKEVKLEQIEFLNSDDAEKSKEKALQTAAQNCMPGKAQVIFL